VQSLGVLNLTRRRIPPPQIRRELSYESNTSKSQSRHLGQRLRQDSMKTSPDIRNPDNQQGREPSVKGLSGAADKEGMDPRYIRRDPRRAGKFFRNGRVFAVLDHSEYTGPETDHSVTTGKWVREVKTDNGTKVKVHSHVRRFAVVREGHGFCWAIPIRTYNGLGCRKRGLNDHDITAHAITYSTDKAPKPLPDEPVMTKMPVAIELGSSADHLDKASRINFLEVKTIEHNVRAMDVGRVKASSMPHFEAYWQFHLLKEQKQTYPARHRTS
jgi:hypothetical protein